MRTFSFTEDIAFPNDSIFYHVTFDLILQPISPFCESFLHLPKPVYCLFPEALQEAQINIFLKPQKAEIHKNKTSVQLRKAGFVPCSMWGETSNADNLKLIKGKGGYIEPVHKEMLYKQTENATLPAVVPFD